MAHVAPFLADAQASFVTGSSSMPGGLPVARCTLPGENPLG
jgi:hypothetical protein